VSRLATFALGAIGVAGIVAGWAAVQIAWKRTFPSQRNEPDALASRGSCHGCSHGDSGGSDDQCR